MQTEIDTAGPEGSIEMTPASMSNSLITYNVTLGQIAKLKEQYGDVPEDLTVKENYKLIKDVTAKVRNYRTSVEKRRKELKADALEYGKKVDEAAKELTEKLLEIETPFAVAKKAFDTAAEIAKREAALAEEKRVDGIAERIAGIKALVGSAISAPSSIIKEYLATVQFEGNDAAEWAQEFSDKAQEAITETWDKLSELFSLKLQQEQAAEKQAEAEAERIRKAEEARKQRDIEIAVEQEKIAAERAAMEAERAKMKAEQDRISKEAAELAAKVKAEQDAKDVISKAEQDAKMFAQHLITAEIEAYADDAFRDMAKRNAEEKAEREKMAAEIEKLKKDQEVANAISSIEEEQEKPSQKIDETGSPELREISSDKVHPLAETTSANVESSLKTTIKEEDYKAAGRAMIKFIGNREVTKNLLDSIIAGSVPHIHFIE